MKRKVFAILMLGLVAAMPFRGILATPQQGNGPPCTNYGCKEIEWMANRFYSGGGWNNGCTQFEDPTTGRKVRNLTGDQGGSPELEPGSQLVWSTTTPSQDCSNCSSPMTPPTQDSIAVDGHLIFGAPPVPFSWDKWVCKQLVIANPGDEDPPEEP